VTILKKALIYLGLGPDEDYDQFDDDVFDDVGSGAAAPKASQPPASRVVAPVPTLSEPAVRQSSVRVIPSTSPPSDPEDEPVIEEARPSGVTIVESVTSTPHVTVPTSFNEAQVVGDRFRSGQAVIINFEGADQALQRRLIDFASGLCYGLGGKMDRVAERVYLLTPANVDVLEADIRRVLR